MHGTWQSRWSPQPCNLGRCSGSMRCGVHAALYKFSRGWSLNSEHPVPARLEVLLDYCCAENSELAHVCVSLFQAKPAKSRLCKFSPTRQIKQHSRGKTAAVQSSCKLVLSKGLPAHIMNVVALECFACTVFLPCWYWLEGCNNVGVLGMM